MIWKKRHGVLKTKARWVKPYRIVLHHTAGGSMSGAVSTLIRRGLGYHYIIQKNGDIHEFVPADRWTPHAYKNNTGTVGISYVGGGKFGPINAKQLASLAKLISILKEDYPSLKEISGHKHVDPRGWKSDPMWPGEKPNKNNWEIDGHYMRMLAQDTDLKFVSKIDLKGENYVGKIKRFL